MIKLYDDKSNCCGCSACEAVCSLGAINMVKDSEGFLYPNIDCEQCIECGACVKVCAFGNDEKKNTPLRILAAKNKDEEIRKNSSSGGVFTALYRYVTENNGTVYGAAYDENFMVKHMRAETSMECEKFRCSKYVQSDMNRMYLAVKEDLKKGRTVLFTGTPCQTAGLSSFLKGINTSGLITCDIVCHGVPSPLIWKKYLELLKKKTGKQVTYVNFRDKNNGWHKSELRIAAKDGNILSEGQGKNAFFKLFFNHYILRPSCYECPYASIDRQSDITIGDFWGIENSMPDYDDDKGISLVLINTQKGIDIYNKISQDIELRESDKQSCLQPNLKAPAVKPPNRELVWNEYYKNGLEYIMKKYTPYGERFLLTRIKMNLRKMKRYIKRWAGGMNCKEN